MDHANELLARIHADRIRPVPRWKVRVARLGVFCLFCATVVASTLSVALAIQELHAHAGRGWIFRKALEERAPWLWGATAALCVWAGVRIFRELPRGWRVRPWHVVAAIAGISLAGGSLIEALDLPLRIHHAAMGWSEDYRRSWWKKAMEEWNAPAQGRLSGDWIGGGDSLDAMDGSRWLVRWEGDGVLGRSGGIRLEGKICGERVFCAFGWKPVPGAGKFHGKRGKKTGP